MKLSTAAIFGIGGGILVYSAFTGKDPRSVVQGVLTGEGLRDLPAIGGTQSGKDPKKGPPTPGPAPKTAPRDLVSKRGYKASSRAWQALSRAEAMVGHQIGITSAYRSYASQEAACASVCGCEAGPDCYCSGRCAKPGTSCHEEGNAFDITSHDCRDPKVRNALEAVGFCNFGASDPCHFCLAGCF